MKKVNVALVAVVSVLTLVGCSYDYEQGSTSAINKEQNALLEESNRQLGMPNITNFFEKDIAKKIWELRDNPDLTTYAYFQNMDGQFVFLGRCIGYGLPYTTQYTSPESLQRTGAGSGSSHYYEVLPQADPNALYSSETTNATWLVLVNEDTNETEIIYSEPSIVVTQSKLPKRLVAEWSLPENY